MKNKNEIVITKIFNAPRELIWKMWTEPKNIKKWWGPNGVTIPECEIDLNLGGKIFIVMEAGESMGPYKGTKWPMLGTFTVVEPNSKLSYTAKAWTEGQNEATEIEQVTEIILSDEHGKTKLHLRAVINKAGPAAGMSVQGMEAGFTQQLEKLDYLLVKEK